MQINYDALDLTSPNLPNAIHRLALLTALLFVCGATASCGTSLSGGSLPAGEDSYASADSAVLAADSEPFRFFSPGSIWNRPLRAEERIDPRSVELVNALNSEIIREQQSGGGPGINTVAYSVPIYTVPAEQPTVRVMLDGRPEPALQAAWGEVPLPPNAHPATGTDGHLVVWQPSTGRLWEFWRLVDGLNGWEAAWGGAMRSAATDPGVYGPEAWPGAKRSWGASASSLSIAGGLITLEDLEHGQINHALAMALPDVRAGQYAAPAERTDGNSASPRALPEGAHLRLNPKLNLAAMHLPRLTLMIAQAAQRYGIVIRDRASHVTFYAQDPTPTGTNQYTRPDGFLEGQMPSELLASFPWNRLEVVKMHLRGREASHR